MLFGQNIQAGTHAVEFLGFVQDSSRRHRLTDFRELTKGNFRADAKARSDHSTNWMPFEKRRQSH
jgi:hypothetical protein